MRWVCRRSRPPQQTHNYSKLTDFQPAVALLYYSSRLCNLRQVFDCLSATFGAILNYRPPQSGVGTRLDIVLAPRRDFALRIVK